MLSDNVVSFWMQNFSDTVFSFDLLSCIEWRMEMKILATVGHFKHENETVCGAERVELHP